jgi:hypothetical protein
LQLPAAPLRYGAIGGAALLLVTSYALGRAAPAAVEAASPVLALADRPNILLIVMDTVHADHLAVYGYERDTTPNLRDLARDSMVYANAISASDITLTSHASLFTGMYPSWHGAYCDPQNAPYGRAVSNRYPTLAELLRSGGYQTIGVAANLYLRADFGLERGFDRFNIPRPVPLLAAENAYMLRRGLRRELSLLFDTAEFDRLYALGEDINTELFGELAAQSKPGTPAFIFVNYMDAHFPYVPPAPYDSQYPGRRSAMTQYALEAEQKILVSGNGVAPGYRPHCVSQYDGGIAYVDHQVGEVVKWLKHPGQLRQYDDCGHLRSRRSVRRTSSRGTCELSVPESAARRPGRQVSAPGAPRNGIATRKSHRRRTNHPGDGGPGHTANHARPQSHGSRGP